MTSDRDSFLVAFKSGGVRHYKVRLGKIASEIGDQSRRAVP
jgi:hypothetical protein